MHAAELVRGALALAEPPGAPVVTVGTFDGIHLGHRRLVARAIEEAAARGLRAVAYTFDPHPAKVLSPATAPPILLPTAERVRIFGELGVRLVVVEPFDARFAEVSADEWVERYLHRHLAPSHVVVGFNFRYGRGRTGDPERLQKHGAHLGFGVEVVGPVSVDGDVVSSTRTRQLLLAGDAAGAARLLGRAYALLGKVEPGEGRGRVIGVPTANLHPENELVPADGVYATWAVLADGRRLSAVTNIGTRPTFAGLTRPHRSVETHLLGFDGDLYGQRLRLELVDRLRPEQRFPDVDALIAQIRRDIAAAALRLWEP